MNTIRMIAIALPMAFLLACGDGGGGSTAAPTVNPFASLTGFETIEDSQTTETFQGILSADMTYSVSSVAEANNFGSEQASSCPNSDFCRVPIDDSSWLLISPLTLAGSFNQIGDLSLMERNLVQQPDNRITPIVTQGEVHFARGEFTGTARSNSDANAVEIQTFAGWLDGSVFGTVQTTIGESNPRRQFFSYSLGVPTGSNPGGTGEATWEGAAVASIKADRTFIHGDATITIPDLASADVDVMLDNWRNINNGQAASGVSAISYTDLTLADGSFEGSGDEQVSGRFYGTDHAEVGGHFNTEDLIGAFGGTRQEAQ